VRAVVQRVIAASVASAPTGTVTSQIDRGLLAFVGVERGDGPADVEYIARKIRELRIFEAAPEPDTSASAQPRKADGFDRSVLDVGGHVLVVSQFTLAADCRKGRRPAFDAAAPPDVARPLYESVIAELRRQGLTVATGQFQTMMQVTLTNDGPVTMLLDSRKRF
jgi:D-tyrosyl-tRNA(Tyr) deacylase